jgi:hypothetical protein
MAKKTIHYDYRVAVFVPSGFGSSRNHTEMMRRAKEVAEQIDRHVDGEGKASIHFSTAAQCEYCGAIWTEDNNIYNDGCCDKDYDNAPWPNS